MTGARFRNVDADPMSPVGSWPLEALRAALERGDLGDYRRIAGAIAAEPWGAAARRVEHVLGWSSVYGVDPLMRRVIAASRSRAEAAEREWVQATLHDALDRSALTRAEFAERLGTSASRLSTYLTGRVVPAATLIARAQRIADRQAAADAGLGWRAP